MGQKPLTILGYELTTPKFTGNSYDIERFDFELLAYYFQNIIANVPLRERALKKYDKMINLISFKQSEDARFYEGQFITSRYGKEQDIIDIYEQVEKGRKPKDHGIKNIVNFLIDTETGLLLLEKDTENVASKNFVHMFIRYHKELIDGYQKAFNNNFSPYKIHKNNFLKVISLPSKSFFEEINEFATIKDAYYYLDISNLDQKSNEASNVLYLHEAAKENGVEDVTRVKISFENDVKKSSVKGVEDYFKKLFEEQYFDGKGVRGKLHSGRSKTIELENIQRSFDISVLHSDEGIPKQDELLNEMSKICVRENPLEIKRATEQFKGVVVDGDQEKREREV